ncbi:DUF3857 domain-containing protein [Nibricoccus sp. IMCC34717]|uniref:DUF3857 domain-containing protein n=1 Tax=Nibricoccus sp. IMCC34717 TaxID=3034021 RepID=UPI00384E270F
MITPSSSTRPLLHRLLLPAFSLGLLCLFLAVGTEASAKPKWDPVDEEIRTAKESVKYPGVSAECLFSTQAIDSSGDTQWLNVYRRFKIYNASAAQQAGVLNIVYGSNNTIRSLSARVIKPNGSITELSDKDFTESVYAKTSEGKLKQKTAAFPNLEGGDVIEYRWDEDIHTGLYEPMFFWIQNSFPTRVYKFTHISTIHACAVLWFNVERAVATKEKGNNVLTVTDVPAYVTEPNMPSDGDVRGMVVLVSTDKWSTSWGKDSAWKDMAIYWGEQMRLLCRPSTEMKQVATSVVANAKSEDEKLALLYNYARNEITNLDYYDNAKLQVIKKKIDKADSELTAIECFNLKAAYSGGVNKVFAALCTAAGFEVEWIFSSDRDVTTLINTSQGFVFLNDRIVVVKTAAGPKAFRPGDLFVKPGLLINRLERAPGLVLDENAKQVRMFAAPSAPAAESLETRSGDFTLNEQGDLEGTASIAYTGHFASRRKNTWHGKSNQELEKLERENLTEIFPNAEITDIRFTNSAGTDEPCSVSFHLKISGFAESAGENQLLNPSIFQKSRANPFSASTRKWPIVFWYAYTQRDSFTIHLPKTLALETPSAPPGFGKETDPIRARYRLAYSKKNHSLTYDRTVVVGDHQMTIFPAAAYEAIKQRFDMMAKADSHTLLLREQTETQEATATPAEETK